MKPLFFLFSFFFFHSHLWAQWDILNDQGMCCFWGDVPTIQFTSEDVGWISGGYLLYKTEDGGENWSKLPGGGSGLIRFRNDTLGYAYAPQSANIYKSEDGGISWMPVFSLPENHSLQNISLTGNSFIYTTGSYFTGFDSPSETWIMKSSDDGDTWEEVTPENPQNNALFFFSHFYDSSHGFVVNRKLHTWRTFDGGRNWQKQIRSQFDEVLALQVVNDSLIYFTARNNNDNTSYYLCLSADTLRNWQILQTSNDRIGPFFALNENIIFSFFSDSVNNLLKKSMDGGATWEIRKKVADGPQSIYFTPQQQGFYIDNIEASKATGGKYGTPQTYFLYKSYDGGDNWDLKKYNYPVTDIFFIDQMTGFLTGGSYSAVAHSVNFGRVFKSHDGGINWDFIPQLGNEKYYKCEFFNRDIGLISTGGSILKTSDGGNTWINSYTSNIFQIRDIALLSEQIFYTVGDGLWSFDSSRAAIFGSNDGGENWDLLWPKKDTEEKRISLNSLHIINTSVWAVGSVGLIVSSVDSDTFKVIKCDTDLPLNDVFFTDEQHGWIAGGYFNNGDFQSVWLKTIDGGQTWQENYFSEYLVNDMFFKDSLHGFAVGEDTSYHGFIIATEDGGETWTPQVEGLSAPLNALHFKDGSGWAASENGLFLRTDNWITWTNPNTGDIYPSGYRLLQNYPNPFNPKTNIEYRIANYEYVNLSIYNLLGQRVATLVNKKQSPGNYRVKWDAWGFSSGIYIYTLETSKGFKKSRKLILLK